MSRPGSAPSAASRTATEWAGLAVAWCNEHPPPPHAPMGSRAPRGEDERVAWRAWDRANHAAGFPQMGWPSEWGGSNARREDILAVKRVMSEAGMPLPLTLIGVDLVGPALMQFGSPEQRQDHLPRIADGSIIWTQLFSEPGSGSDLASLRTKATRREDGSWSVSGQKVWNTFAADAEWGYLIARTGPQEGRHRELGIFLVPMDAAGITIVPIREITGTADFNEVFFDEVVLPADAIVGEPGQGWAITLGTLSDERTFAGQLVVNLLVEAGRLTHVVAGLGARASSHRQRLGTLIAELAALDALIASDRDEPGADNLGKIVFGDVNISFNQLAVDVCAEFPDAVPAAWARRWSDAFLYARAYTISGGANEVLRNVVGQRDLGLPRPTSRP